MRTTFASSPSSSLATLFGVYNKVVSQGYDIALHLRAAGPIYHNSNKPRDEFEGASNDNCGSVTLFIC